MNEYPKVVYHENGDHKVLTSEAEALDHMDEWSDTHNEKTIRKLRKASGSARTDMAPGTYVPVATEPY